MILPSEITMVNLDGVTFRARPTNLYNKVRQAFQYRVILPGVAISMVVIDVTENELRDHLRTGKPVTIRPLL
jgi:hypothetical protein